MYSWFFDVSVSLPASLAIFFIIHRLRKPYSRYNSPPANVALIAGFQPVSWRSSSTKRLASARSFSDPAADKLTEKNARRDGVQAGDVVADELR